MSEGAFQTIDANELLSMPAFHSMLLLLCGIAFHQFNTEALE
jgi:hypothetical protein